MNKKLIKQSVIGLLLGGGAVWVGYSLISKEVIAKIYAYDNPLIMVPSLIFAVFFAIGIHEFGHLFMGIIQGFKVELFVVGFLGVERRQGKLKLFFNKDAQYFGGIAATSPNKKYPDIRKRFAWIVAGGPLFSVLFGCLLFVVFSFQNSEFNSFLAFSGFISLLLFLATTLPEKSGSFFTDRKRLQRLLDKGHDGKVELALLESINQNFIDGHCKNLQLDNLEIIKKAKEPFIQFWGYYFELQYLRDVGQQGTNAELMSKLKSYEEYFPKASWKTFGIE